MATVIEECTTEDQFLLIRFLLAKGLNAKYFHKEMFPVYGGKFLSRKADHSWVKRRGSRFADDEEGAEMVETRAKNFSVADFGELVKRWDKRVNVAEGYVEK
jgi:hypothetical protein